MAYDGTVTTSDLADHKWLDDDEMRLWRSYIEVSVRLVSALDARLKAAAGVSFDDYEVLLHLSEASDRRLRMAELSDRLIHSRSRLTQRIDRLARRGLVRREKCEGDRRGTWAVLTDEGLATIEELAPDHVRAVRQHLFDHVGVEEQEAMTAAFERLALHLRSICDGEQA